MKKSVFKIILAALFIALAFLLPFLTSQIREVGNMLLPMHLPVLICGFILGEKYGALVGFVSPLLRSFILGMPVFPIRAIPMAFELAAYGFLAGLLYKLLPKKPFFLYLNLVLTLILGRIVWAALKYIMIFFGGKFGFEIFLLDGFVNAWLGIVLQFIIIPPIVLFLKKEKLISDK